MEVSRDCLSRHRLDLEQPLLRQATEWLQTFKPPKAGLSDLSQLTVVFSSSRAIRRATELFVESAERRGEGVILPKMITLGSLPEVFYDPRENGKISAGDLTLRSLYRSVLAGMTTLELELLFPAGERVGGGFGDLLRFSDLVFRLHKELLSAEVLFVDAAELAQGDQSRWEVLSALQARYLELLSSSDVSDRYYDRLAALRSETQARCDTPIILCGITELSKIQRSFLRHGSEIHCLYQAADGEDNLFDQFGCPLSPHWSLIDPPPPSCRRIYCKNPEVEAVALIKETVSLSEQRLSPSEITLGLLNESVWPFLRQLGEEFQVPFRKAEGIKLAETSLYHALLAVRLYTSTRELRYRFDLFRSPDFVEFVGSTESYDEIMLELDRYRQRHLQFLGSSTQPSLPSVLKPLDDQFEKLTGIFSKERNSSLADWLQVFFELAQTYPGSAEVVSWTEGLELDVSTENEQLSGDDFLSFIVFELSRASEADQGRSDVIDVLGWLELLADDADVLLLSGCNEDFVPTRATPHPFLAEGMRKALGLPDRDERVNRDGYIFRVLCASRKQVILTFSEVSLGQEKLFPSRFLLGPDGRSIAKTILELEGQSVELKRKGALSTSHRKIFELSKCLKKGAIPDTLSVTAFKAYRTCPFRFYLSHIQRVQTPEHDLFELDNLGFGSVAHDILANFGRSPIRNSKDEKEIAKYLHNQVAGLERQFGEGVYPAVRLQLEMLKLRLAAFAKWQADWRASGWMIDRVEWDIDPARVKLGQGEARVALKGRIDRIDRHETDEELFVIDYKTSESVVTPEEAHVRKGEWVDYQLPLYSFALCSMDEKAPRLGYLGLGANSADVELREANWTEESLASCVAEAADIARNIRSGKFWPPTSQNAVQDPFSYLFIGQKEMREDLV